MTELMQMRVVGFVRTIAGECSKCFLDRSKNCQNCVAKRANLLLVDIASEENAKPIINYTIYTRIKEIKKILTESGRPMRAREIKLSQECTPQLKFWTLNQMVLNGTIGKKTLRKDNLVEGRKRFAFYYYMKNKETK